MIKKRLIVIVVLLMCLTASSANGDVLVSDGFENDPNGTPTVTVDGNGDEVSSLMPDVGGVAWTRYIGQQQGSPVISAEAAYTGTQSQKHVRPTGGDSTLVTVSAGPLSVGSYILSGALNTLDTSSSGNLALTTDDGAFITAISTASFSGGSSKHYTQVLNNGTAYAIAYKDPSVAGAGGIYMTPGEWTLFELVLDVVDAGGGMLDGTATLFYNQGGVNLASSSAPFELAAWDAVAGVNLFTGANNAGGPAAPEAQSTVYWDDVEISLGQAAFYCPYAIHGDVDRNCRVDLDDFALLSANWLVDCIADPNDPACIVY